jgi:hypothetical protein
MKKCLSLLSAFLLLSIAAATFAAGSAEEPATNPAAKQQDPSFAPVADDPNLPRVLLIGDSISMGYTLPVREMLKGKANVHRPPANCGDSGRGLKNLDKWLATDGDTRWAIIHFNFGLHDLKYLDANGKYVSPDKGKQVASTETYEKNLRELVARFQKTGAKLIWATTTPVPDGSLGRIKGDEVKYNTVAEKVMTDNHIAIDDLWQIAHNDQSKIQRPHNVHYTDAGYQELAASVAKSIEAALTSQ